MTALEIRQVAEPYIRRRAIRHLEKGRLVIFAAGTGNPYFSTDTAAALRAMEIHASALFKATKVEGIYDRDPARHGDAKMFTRLTYDRFLADRIGVMDSTAVTLCRDNKMPIRVFKLTAARATSSGSAWARTSARWSTRRVAAAPFPERGQLAPDRGIQRPYTALLLSPSRHRGALHQAGWGLQALRRELDASSSSRAVPLRSHMWQSLPLFGKLVLYAVMIAAAYTFSVAVVSGRGKPRYLQAARLGAYGTVSLIGLAILCLSYAFVTHDFRIKYVAHYSDRSMADALPVHLAVGRAGRLAPLVAVSPQHLHGGVRLVAEGQIPRASAVHHRDADGDRPLLLRAHDVRGQSVLDERRRSAHRRRGAQSRCCRTST